ncbi:DUF6188 family protein [Nocardia sp. NPDC003345]
MTCSRVRATSTKIAISQAVENGKFRLEFDSGAVVHALTDPDYEFWSIVGLGGFRVECMPGGELAVWAQVRRSGYGGAVL